MTHDELWKKFPGTALQFERRFRTEKACREYLIEVRWAGVPRCGRCGGTEVWSMRRRAVWQCSGCGYQTSVTAGTPLQGTRKPLRMWFRAMWEVVTRKNGISAKDLQRLLGLRSYQTAWTWLHKLRAMLSTLGHEPLSGTVQTDEGFVGGHRLGSPKGRSTAQKKLVIVAAEPSGRIRLSHGPDSSSATFKRFFALHVAHYAAVTTDGWRGYRGGAMGDRAHRPVVQSTSDRRKHDALQHCHWAIAQLKRWWLGTHHGAIGTKHAQAYLDEFTFRFNRRKTKGIGRLVARAFQQLVGVSPKPYKLLKTYQPFPHFVPEGNG